MRNTLKYKTPDQLLEELEAAAVAFSITREVTSLEVLIAASLKLGQALEDTAKTSALSPLVPEAA